jgi:hypothetical protein
VLARLFLAQDVVQKAWALPIYTSLAIPITVLALVWVSRTFLAARAPEIPQFRGARGLRQDAPSE